jgi:ABC-2 type transport system ATP-binding protein
LYAIEARGLTKTFRGTRAVAGVDLLVEEGEIVALLGPNGAGKTTTLMMLLGVTEPDAGTVRLLGHPLPQERTQALEKMNFAASYLDVPDRMRVSQVLEVFARIHGASPERVSYLVDLFGVREFVKRRKEQLSSGQKTLVGLVRSMLNRPRLLVLDEPTSSLDPDVAQRVRDILVSIHAEDGFTILITSHNMVDVQRLCRRVVFMAGGRVVADGTPEEIADRYGTDDLEHTFRSIAMEAVS